MTTTNTPERATARAEGRDIASAAKYLIVADDEWLKTVAHRDPDMIRDVARALDKIISPPERWHNDDCELRGSGPCYCEQPGETNP